MSHNFSLPAKPLPTPAVIVVVAVWIGLQMKGIHVAAADQAVVAMFGAWFAVHARRIIKDKGAAGE